MAISALLTVPTVSMAISVIVLDIFFVIIARSVISIFVSIVFIAMCTLSLAISIIMTISALMSVPTIARCTVSAMSISTLAMSISAIAMSVSFTITTITMSVAFAISVMVIASIAVAIQIRVVADRCVMWSKFMKVIEGSNDMRSIKSMGKFYFRRTRFVKHLNGDVFFPTFMQFFCTRHCTTFRFDGYTFRRI